MLQNVLRRVGFSQRVGITLAIMCLVFTAGAQANVIVPGGPAALPDVFGSTGLTVLASTGLTAFVSSGAKVSGNYVAGVFADAGNPFGAGDLDFLYQVFVGATSPDAIGRVTGIDFTGFSTDVGYTPTGSTIGGPWVNGTVVPQLVDRTAGGDSVGFAYASPNSGGVISPGLTSVVMIIKTNATAFKPGTMNLIDGGVTPVAAFAPSTSSRVPEPASFALMGAGLLAFAGIRRFRRQ